MLKKSNKGFTLIELLVVISIIALLSSVVLSSLSEARSRARDARRISDLRQIDTAIQMYALDNKNALPGDEAERYYSNNTSSWQTLGTVLRPYINTLPVDPLNGKSYEEKDYKYNYKWENCNGCGKYYLEANILEKTKDEFPFKYPFRSMY